MKYKVMSNPMKCDICGKFIGYSEFDRDEIKVEFIPDTQFTTESTTYIHKKCLEKQMMKSKLSEYKKCIKSPYYFATKYLTIMGANGETKSYTTRLTEKEFNEQFKELADGRYIHKR